MEIPLLPGRARLLTRISCCVSAMLAFGIGPFSDHVSADDASGAASANTAAASSEAPSGPTKIEVARGIVFEDLNGNRKHDTGEPGIADVRISNGRKIVRTDAEGHYAIEVDQDDIVFVIKPRNWMTPVNHDRLPQFFYIHKPAGSPGHFRFPGVDPTGPLPKSIDFPLYRHEEPDRFRAILFGDPQPRNVKEVDYMSHDVIEQIIANNHHDASFGVTLGDIVFDDLSIMQPHNQAIALIGIPWYNVIGNHDMNTEAVDDAQSDETFERHYGPSYYSFDHGPAHFIVLDNVVWHGATAEQKGHYHGGLGADQIAFIRNDLELIPEDQLVVLMMHIPLNETADRQDLYRLIEQRPATVSISAHKHYMEHRWIGSEDGWQGPQRHHHIVNVTVCGSWWRGSPDERGIPHATMSDGGPNGYTVMEFDGARYSWQLFPASRPAEQQMRIYAPDAIERTQAPATVVMANIFAASEQAVVSMRVGPQAAWTTMERVTMADPDFVAEKQREQQLPAHTWTDLPAAHPTPHIWRGMLPPSLPVGTHAIEIRCEENGKQYSAKRIIRVQP